MSSLALPEMLMRAAREALVLVLLLSAPPLLATVLVGLLVGTAQAATQVHDPSVAFVPKLVVVVLVLVAMGPALGTQVLRFSQALFEAIAQIR